MKIPVKAIAVCTLLLLAPTPGFAQDTPPKSDKPPEDIRDLKLRDWQPQSMLKTKVTRVNTPKFSVIDVHNHLGGGAKTLTEERVKRYLREMDDAGVRTVVNLDGGWDDNLKETIAALDEAHPGRFLTFALIDLRGFDQEGWTERETARLRKSFEAGAKGVKFHKSLGLSYRDKEGKLLTIDDPRLDLIWALCGEMNRPVMIHTSDPAAFFTPLDRHNERWHELNDHPNWLFFGARFPSREELLDQRNRAIAKHPRTTFIGAHFGNNPEDLETVGKWLDMYPNFYVDIDARISELGRQPYSCRRFFIKYQDRIMFGTDTTPKADAYRLYYRFLETDDEYFDTAESHHRQGFWMIYGIFLPEPVLEKIYYANAARILGLKPSLNARAAMFDVIIRHGDVIDGTGRDRYRADVAVLDGVIVEIGELPDAKAHRVVDATGKLVVPGFIDLHSHAESGLVSDDPARRSAPNLITQGITTVVVNQDGGGPLDMADQRRTMERLGVGLNVVQVIGHGTIRDEVMGDDFERPATVDEMEQMQQHLRTALTEGAFGMSAGLEYDPGRWSTPREMEALAKTVASADGVYIVHERSSGSRPMWYMPSRDTADQPSMIDNLRELIQIAAKTKVTTVATHIKARGVDYWGSAQRMNDLIQRARDSGLPLYADQYPYNTSGSDGQIVLIPSWATSASEKTNEAKPDEFAAQLEGVLVDKTLAADVRRDVAYEITRRGGAAGILIVEHSDAELVGKTLAEFAAKLEVDPVEAAIALQLQGDRTRRGGARLRAFSMSEEDVEAFAQTPWTATSSDAGITLPSDGPVHPRLYGAFPRKIRRYAIDRGLLTIEEAVRVSTSLPASILKLDDRGVIRRGATADLVVFDPERIRDMADEFKNHQYADGIEYVFVNGQLAVEQQRCVGSLAGRVAKRPGAP